MSVGYSMDPVSRRLPAHGLMPIRRAPPDPVARARRSGLPRRLTEGYDSFTHSPILPQLIVPLPPSSCETAASRRALRKKLRALGSPPPAASGFMTETVRAAGCSDCSDGIEARLCSAVAGTVIIDTAREHHRLLRTGEEDAEWVELASLAASAEGLVDHLFALRRHFPEFYPEAPGDEYIFLEGFLRWCRSRYDDSFYDDIFQEVWRASSAGADRGTTILSTTTSFRRCASISCT